MIDEDLNRYLKPSRENFSADPFGYSSMALDKWRILQNLNGFDLDMEAAPSREELNSPVLWLCQSQALTEAARTIIASDPEFKLPKNFHGICDSQYRAAGVMLIGYSLEICLKGTLIIKHGIDGYLSDEKKHQHHRLVELAEYIPALNDKDKVILELISIFVEWGGRYPAPKPKKEGQREDIYQKSNAYQISASDLFDLSSRVMKYTSVIVCSK